MSSWKEYNGGNVKISNINEWDEELLVKKKRIVGDKNECHAL